MQTAPLAETRCARCHAASTDDRDREATAAIFGDADAPEFVCRWCARTLDPSLSG